MSRSVFVSYSSADRSAAESVCAALETAGIPCWMAPRDAAPGANYQGSIVRAIRECHALVLVFSSHANESVHVFREVHTASQERRPIVPFRIDDTVPSDDYAYYLSALHWLDASVRPLQPHLERLVEALRPLVPDEAAAAGTYPSAPAARRSFVRRRSGRFAAAATVLLISAGWLARDSLPVVGRAGHGGLKTIAVLPLANHTGDVQQEFFADGLTEALIADLSQLSGVNVISRTSVMQYKLVRKSIRDIARELHADALLEGALLREGERVRVTARLVRGKDEQRLWTATYDGRVGDMFSLQRQVGFAVAREIRARFAATGAPRTAAIKPESQQATYKGSYYAGQWRLEEAIASFRKAVEIDPTNAAAYAALARAYYFRTFIGEVAPREGFSQMEQAAHAALAQDAQLGDAHGLIALVHTHYTYDWAAAEQHFARALALNPSNAQVHHDYAHFLLAMGRGPESVEESRRAMVLDPANAMLTSCLAWHSLFDEQFEQSLEYAAEAQRLMPGYWAQIVQGWALAARGRHEDAIESMREAVSLAPDLPFTQAALAHMLARYADRREARRLLDSLLREARQAYVPAYDIAVVYAGLDEFDEAFAWLARAVEERSMFVVHMTWDMRLDPLRRDARFDELVRTLGIPASAMRRGPAASGVAAGAVPPGPRYPAG